MTRLALVVFAFFAGVAVQYAGAKHGGTNAPPNGASPLNGNVELKMENVELSLSVAVETT